MFDVHRGHYTLGTRWPRGNADALTPPQRATVDEVLRAYGDFSARQLSLLTHSERPWADARKGLAPHERGAQVIDPLVMADYYSSLLDDVEDTEPVRGSTLPD